jgi:hypothetical protein
VKSYIDQSACEQTLPELGQRAKAAKDFINAITDAAGNRSAGPIEFREIRARRTKSKSKRRPAATPTYATLARRFEGAIKHRHRSG